MGACIRGMRTCICQIGVPIRFIHARSKRTRMCIHGMGAPICLIPARHGGIGACIGGMRVGICVVWRGQARNEVRDQRNLRARNDSRMSGCR